jgi:uncharacterized protein (DUF1810 family)
MEQIKAKQRNLLRFIHAQDCGGIYDNTSTYKEALQEIRNGYKKSHWIWYVFPQMKGLGKSEISEFYGINGREEANEYFANPILRERLIEATQAVLNNKYSVYGSFHLRQKILLEETIWQLTSGKQLLFLQNGY